MIKVKELRDGAKQFVLYRQYTEEYGVIMNKTIELAHSIEFRFYENTGETTENYPPHSMKLTLSPNGNTFSLLSEMAEEEDVIEVMAFCRHKENQSVELEYNSSIFGGDWLCVVKYCDKTTKRLIINLE